MFIARGVVHAWVGQKLLKCYIFKSFYERSFLDDEVIMEEAGKRDQLEYDVDNDDDSVCRI
jgi:hypothetical protein